MKKTFIIVLLLVICLICCSCNSSNGETNISDSKSDSLTSDIVDNLNSSNDTSTEQSIVISTETPCEHSYGEWNAVLPFPSPKRGDFSLPSPSAGDYLKKFYQKYFYIHSPVQIEGSRLIYLQNNRTQYLF